MPRTSTVVLAVLLAAIVPASAAAHGGTYRPPGVPVIPGGIPVGPATGGPAMPGGPNTSSGTGSVFTDSWSWWWEFNKDRYLRLKELVRGGDDGIGSVADGDRTGPAMPAAPTGLGPTPEDLRDKVLPALLRLIESTDNRDVQTACMMAMAKVGARHPEIDMLAEFRKRIASGNQEVRETAALALGVSGLPDAADDLVALIRDERRGRDLVGRGSVDERTRAFATYGLALVARRDPGVELRGRAFEVFAGLLASGRDREPLEASRDVRVAAWQGLGVLRPDPARSLDKRLVWRALELVATELAKDARQSDEIVRAHVPATAARLLGRGDTLDHRRFVALFVELVDPRAPRARDRHFLLEQSAAQALGELALAPGTHEVHDAASRALRDYFEDGRNQDARKFSAVALGRIGGPENREWLLRAHRGAKSRDQPWLALALGILVRDAIDQGRPTDPEVLDHLHRSFRTERNAEHRGVVATVLGLCGHTPAEPLLVDALDDSMLDEVYGGELATGLGLLGTPKAQQRLRFVLANVRGRPMLFSRAAIGLALSRDPETTPRLIATLDESDSLARLVGVATAFRYVGDRRAIDPLIERMFARDTTTLTRAFLAAALGGLADKDLLPFNEPFAAGSNYFANVETLRDGVAGILDIL